MIRWFGRWLRDEDTGVDSEPPIRLFVRHATRPSPTSRTTRACGATSRRGRSNDRAAGATRTDGPGGTDELAVRPDVGVRAWISCAGSLPWGQSQDLREDGAWSLTYDWPVESGPLEILGHPCVRVRLRSDAGRVAVSEARGRLPRRDVGPRHPGFLNLTHRQGSGTPTPLPIDEDVEVGVELEAASYVFPRRPSGASGPGRDRLAQHLATADAGDAHRRAEQRPARAAERRRPRSGAGAATALGAARDGEDDDDADGDDIGTPLWRLEHDVLARRSRRRRPRWDIPRAARRQGDRSVPRTGRGLVARSGPELGVRPVPLRAGLAGGHVRGDARLEMVSDAERFRVTIDLEVTEDGLPFACRHWTESIGRDLL